MAWSISARCSARFRGLPGGASLCSGASRGLVLSVEQQQRRGVGEDQRVTQLERAERSGTGPVHIEHPGPDRADPQREHEDRPGSGLTCRGSEGRPAVPGFHSAQVRGQNGPAGSGRIQRWPFSQGQLELGELLADRIGDPHQVAGFPVAGRRQPAAGNVNRGHGRHAGIRGGHAPAPAGRLDGDQAPDPARPATCHPHSPAVPYGRGRSRVAFGLTARCGLEESGHPGRPVAMSRRSGQAPAPPARLRGSRCPLPGSRS